MYLGDIVVLTVLATSVWVFFDAPRIGESRTWTIGVLLLWIIAFPWYLSVRSKKLRSTSPDTGAPPPPSTGSLPPPAWLPDPDNPGGRRWWDGQQWTEFRD